MQGDDLSWRFLLRSQRLLCMNCEQFAALLKVPVKKLNNWRSGLYEPELGAGLRLVKELKRQGLLDKVLSNALKACKQ